jgi:hypothetical protein
MLTVKQAASRCNLSPNSLYSAIETGLLECHRLRSRPDTRGAIRITEEQLQAYLEGGKVRKGEHVSPSLPSQKAAGFTHLDGERLLSAWRQQGVLDGPPSAGSAPSCASRCGPSARPES